MTFKVCGENTGEEIVIWFKGFPPEKKSKTITCDEGVQLMSYSSACESFQV